MDRWCCLISYANTYDYKPGFDHNYYMFTSILLITIVTCGKFPWTKFMDYKCFEMKSWVQDPPGWRILLVRRSIVQFFCLRKSIQTIRSEHSHYTNVNWFQGGLVFKAHKLLHRSTLGLKVINKKEIHTRGSDSRYTKFTLEGECHVVTWLDRCISKSMKAHQPEPYVNQYLEV